MQLMNGDCLELMKGIPDGTVDMVLCDLPYGTTQNKWDSVIPFDLLWTEYRRACRKGASIVLTAAQPFTSALVMSNPAQFKYQWVWEKSRPTGHLDCNRKPLRLHEDVCVFYSGQPTYNPQGLIPCNKIRKARSTNGTNYGSAQKDSVSKFENYPTSVLICPSEDNRSAHPTQKPVALMEYLIRTYTNEGMTILDNCMGSGTTGVACVNTGRKFIGIEMDAGYFEIAQRRIAGAIAAKDLADAISLATDAADKTA